jgi:predicted transcriptional regulator
MSNHLFDRNVSGVSQDLDLLFEADIIEFETDGQRQIPCLKHEVVVAESSA